MPTNRAAEEFYDDIPAIVADQVSEALYQQDYFIHTVLNTVDTLIVVMDTKGRIILFNAACEQLTGYTFDEVKGKPFWDLFLLPEEKDEVVALGRNMLSTAERSLTVRHTNHWVARDGQAYLISWSNSALQDCQGCVQFIVSTGINITEQEKAQKALEYSEKLFHSLFDNANDAIFVAPLYSDGFGNYIEVNNTASKMLGYSREEILQMAPSTIPVDDERYRRKFYGNRSATFEMTLLTKDGQPIPFEHNAHLFELGGQTYSLAIARDVRERKQKEQELHENEERYRQLVEMSPEAIFVHANDHFLYANKACVELLRAESLAWLLTRKVSETIHPDYQGILLERIKKHKAGSPPSTGLDHLICCFDGSVAEVESIGSHLYYNGEPAVQVILRDITKKKKLEQEVLRDSKLKSIGSLAGNIAHEYNNILTVIMGNLSLAQYYAADFPQVKDILQQAEEASRQAQELSQHLLTFARGGHPVKRVIDMRKLLLRSADVIMRTENASCNLSVPGELYSVDADENQIYHAITNIVTNALQAMPEGGTVHIAAENTDAEDQQLRTVSEGPFVRIMISDEGTGIPAEHIGNVFDPFFSTRPDGNGLGLSTSYSIIKKHGGFISVESVEGEGAAFTIYLPAVPANGFCEQQHQADLKGSGRILFMDDEVSVRKTTQEMLSILGYEVTTATTGEEALKLYKEAVENNIPFKYVILDLRIIGGMGGKETLTHLREFDPHVRAIVSSGYFSDPVMANYKKYGFLGCVPKPFTIEQMGKVLKELG